MDPLGYEPALPLVSIVIVHYNNDAYLRACLSSIGRLTYPNLEVIIVDNGTPKVSLSDMHYLTFEIRHVASERNLGFGDGCNKGIALAKADYVFLLNNDIELDQRCVSELVRTMTEDEGIGILQPKMLDYHNRVDFHSSAGGGLIDVLGYPFARGRLFDRVERDAGQYDQPIEIFWASGAALFARKSALVDAMLFDEDFFMYMEEIDLAWRVHLRGTYRVVYLPSAVIYHIGSPNLKREHPLRIFYQHKNSLLMLMKNYTWGTLMGLLPVRVSLDVFVALASMVQGDWRRSGGIFWALGHIMAHLPSVMRKRRVVQALRKTGDRAVMMRMYKGSIVLKYAFSKHNLSRVMSAIPVTPYHKEGPPL